MGMKQTIDVINKMEADGVVARYAIGGAVAAYNYIEPTVTEDLDILVSFDEMPGQPKSGLVTLGPLYSYLQKRGYEDFVREGILVDGWLVQFLPVADALDAEGLAAAIEIDLEINPLQKNHDTGFASGAHRCNSGKDRQSKGLRSDFARCGRFWRSTWSS
jgi:hypothetical protein